MTTFAQDFVWYTNSPILFLCALLLWRRGQSKRFPYFFIYLLFVGIQSYALIPVSHHWGFSSLPYIYGSYGGDLVSVGLTFVILYEVMRDVLTSGTLKVNRMAFVLLTAILLLVSAFISTLMEVQGDLAIMRAILRAMNIVRVEQVAVLLLLAVATLFFGFYWRNLAFGIAAGFGLYASMSLVSIYLRSDLGATGTHIANLVDNWSYEVASLIWLFYISRRPRTSRDSLPSDKLSQYSDHIETMIK